MFDNLPHNHQLLKPLMQVCYLQYLHSKTCAFDSEDTAPVNQPCRTSVISQRHTLYQDICWKLTIAVSMKSNLVLMKQDFESCPLVSAMDSNLDASLTVQNHSSF